MIKNIALISILSASAIATNALAIENKLEDQKNYYFQLNTGASYGTIPRGEFVNASKSSVTPLLGAELGYKIDENFRAGFDLSYRPNYTFKDTTTESYSENNIPENVVHKSKYKVKSFTAMANFYYDILTTNNITPYLTVGAGLARNTVKENEINNTTISNGYSTSSETITSTISTSKNNFAYKVGLGAKYAINQDFDLDLRYQYINLGKIKANETSVSTTEKGKLRSQEVVLGIAYKF